MKTTKKEIQAVLKKGVRILNFKDREGWVFVKISGKKGVAYISLQRRGWDGCGELFYLPDNDFLAKNVLG